MPILPRLPIPSWQTRGEMAVWGLPAVGIPTLRYFQDDKDERLKLFVRDGTTYTIGALTYFAVSVPVRAMLKKLAKPMTTPVREFFSILAGVGGNVLYAGIGAVKVSEWVSRKTSAHKQMEALEHTEANAPKAWGSTASAPLSKTVVNPFMAKAENPFTQSFSPVPNFKPLSLGNTPFIPVPQSAEI